MIYTFAVLRSPLKVVVDPQPDFKHYFGGSSEGLALPAGTRFARILTLDLSDPKLSFLRLQGPKELPLVMDFARGTIGYSVEPDGTLHLHSAATTEAASLLEHELPRRDARLDPIPYEQYRAAIFARAVVSDSNLSPADSAAIAELGESYTQVGGSHARAASYSPYCSNPGCSGHGIQVTQALATVSQLPAPDVSLEFLPYDPAVEFYICLSCHSVSGVIVPD